jgi:pilus assembly protein CpaB
MRSIGGFMKNIGQRLILISFMFALIAAIATFIYLQSLKSPKAEEKKITILVAAETIPPRTLIDKKMVTQLQVENNTIFQDYIKDRTEIIGKYNKETISKNEGFQKNKLLAEDENELSMKIDKTHRAISINVTGDGGVSDLIKPGDFVDIVVYLSEKKDGVKVLRPDMAKVILQYIEILAINKQLDREEKTEETKEKLINFLVTISVPIDKLEKVVLAESTGSIKLALRSLKNSETTETNGTTWEELIEDEKSDEPINSSQDSNSDSSKSDRNDSNKDSGDKNIDKEVVDRYKEYNSYKVKHGDTLRSISKQFYGDPEKYPIIKQANNKNNGNLIVNGEVLKIPILE